MAAAAGWAPNGLLQPRRAGYRRAAGVRPGFLRGPQARRATTPQRRAKGIRDQRSARGDKKASGADHHRPRRGGGVPRSRGRVVGAAHADRGPARGDHLRHAAAAHHAADRGSPHRHSRHRREKPRREGAGRGRALAVAARPAGVARWTSCSTSTRSPSSASTWCLPSATSLGHPRARAAGRARAARRLRNSSPCCKQLQAAARVRRHLRPQDQGPAGGDGLHTSGGGFRHGAEEGRAARADIHVASRSKAGRSATTSWGGYTANLDVLQKARGQRGHINSRTDDDGIIRRVPMLAEYDGAYYEPLSLAMVRVLLGSPPVRGGLAGRGASRPGIIPISSGCRSDRSGSRWTTRRARWCPIAGARAASGIFPSWT